MSIVKVFTKPKGHLPFFFMALFFLSEIRVDGGEGVELRYRLKTGWNLTYQTKFFSTHPNAEGVGHKLIGVKTLLEQRVIEKTPEGKFQIRVRNKILKTLGMTPLEVEGLPSESPESSTLMNDRGQTEGPGGDSSFILPENPMKEGDQWEEKGVVGGESRLIQFKYKGIQKFQDQECALILSKSSFSNVLGQHFEIQGTLLFNLQDGVLIRGRTLNKISTPSPIDPMELLKMETKSEVLLVKREEMGNSKGGSPLNSGD